jgi:hypothetical protein
MIRVTDLKRPVDMKMGNPLLVVFTPKNQDKLAYFFHETSESLRPFLGTNRVPGIVHFPLPPLQTNQKIELLSDFFQITSGKKKDRARWVSIKKAPWQKIQSFGSSIFCTRVAQELFLCTMLRGIGCMVFFAFL